METVDKVIHESIVNYVSSLSEKDLFIFQSRTGCNTPYLTLSDVGEKIKRITGSTLTRERVRQIQSNLIDEYRELVAPYIDDELYVLLFVSPGWDCIDERTLPKTVSLFDTFEDFTRFMGYCLSEKGQKAMDSLTARVFDKNVLDEFWATVAISPISIAELSEYICVHLNKTEVEGRNLIYGLLEDGSLHYDKETGLLSPLRLTKAMALSHAAMFFKDGAPWLDIQRKVNELNVCNKKITVSRLDYAIGTAVDFGYIYQSGRGEYSHISNLFKVYSDMGNVRQMLDKLRDIIAEQYGETGAHPLSVIYSQNQSLFGEGADYFIVRYIIKQFGGMSGIRFSGLSGSDVVTLDKNGKIDILSRQEIIINQFSDGQEFGTDDILPLLRSESTRHASFLLDNLVLSRDIVKLNRDDYVVASFANKGLNIDKIMQYCYGIAKANRNEKVSYDSLYRAIKDKPDMAVKSGFHLSSILRSHYQDLNDGHKWVFCGANLGQCFELTDIPE